MFTAWRLRYGLPPTDPRAIDVTEEEVLYDLLVLRWHDQLGKVPIDVDNPEEVLLDMEARARAFLATPEQQRAIARATKGGTPEELAHQRRPQAIRMTGSVASPAKKKKGKTGKTKKVRP